jgi:hypothetical protein
MNDAALLTTVEDRREAAPAALPPLPIEGNLVAAVRALEAASRASAIPAPPRSEAAESRDGP